MERKVLVSYCLLGKNCRFDGKNRFNAGLVRFLNKNKVKPVGVCPEELGGLKGKRGPFEFKGRPSSVINGKTAVRDIKGADFTANFIKGAYGALSIARKNRIRLAILKSKSPSCGCDYTYNGSFKKIVKKGLGITAYILKKNKIRLFSDNQYKKLRSAMCNVPGAR
ncbi:MAG: DUF523 domain-containing protein [Candidatus Omnitrophica bacterium]|nr:DUF523 domain-containing protein [Candidatus Omnitrophota bacterium]